MRARKKKHEAERISACRDLLCCDPEKLKENPAAFFPAEAPLHLEIGCGKGDFACGMAAAHPEVNFLALERISGVMVTALEKAEAARADRPRDNLRFLIADARTLPELLPPHSLSCIYINFCDPWPKKGYVKRRLTYRAFLDIYRQLLVPGGMIRFKTDNEPLFDFSLEEFAAAGFTLLSSTRDLHASPLCEGNVMTEYERNFSSQGMPIFSAVVRVG